MWVISMMLTDNKELWGKAASEIELNVSKANFNTWFKNTHILKQEDDVVYLAVPNAFVKDWLLNKYHKFILKILRDSSSNVRALEYIIQKEEERQKEEEKVAVSEAVYAGQMEMNEIYINKDDNLNPRYTFENFVVGSFNELAHAAGQAVIKKPGRDLNPLFIYGGTGLGKTHLIQAIGNEVKKMLPNHKIHYLSLEKFSNDYVDSVKNNKINFFKEKYRKYDLLIMDDIQFISEKEGTQDELFHLFNYLYENNKQIVFSCDKPAKHIPKVEERLRSRFEGGMQADVSKPDYESRLAILRAKVRGSPFAPPGEVVEYVASVISDNIRELEGVFNAIVCQCRLRNKNLTLIEVKNLIKNSIKQQKTISIKDVIKTVAAFYNVEEKTLYEKTRRKEIVKPRQVIMYILREDFNTSYPYIGQKLGGRDHTTVIHAYEKIKGDIKVDNLLNQELEQIKSLLYSDMATV